MSIRKISLNGIYTKYRYIVSECKEKSQILADWIFDVLSDMNVSYYVIPYEYLPSSNDDSISLNFNILTVDTLLLKKMLCEISEKYGLKMFIKKEDKNSIDCIICRYNTEIAEIVEFHIYSSILYKNNILFELKKWRAYLENNILPNGIMAYAIFSISIINKIICEQFVKYVCKLSKNDFDMFKECVVLTFGKEGKFFCQKILQNDLKEIMMCFNSLADRLNYKHTLKSMMNSFNTNNYHKGYSVAIMGVDGAGKTTVICLECMLLKSFFNEVIPIHYRHGVLPKLKDPFKYFRIHRKGTYGKAEKYFAVIYYTLSFALGNRYFRRHKDRGNFLFFDRYYYDFFMHESTRDLVFPIKNILLRFVDKPDLIIHLNADSAVIYKRKSELSISEIESENKHILKFIEKMSDSYSIDTTKLSEFETAMAVFRYILNII